jgi:hypothetical protein
MFRFEDFKRLYAFFLSDPQVNTGVIFIDIYRNTLSSSLHNKYLSTPSLLVELVITIIFAITIIIIIDKLLGLNILKQQTSSFWL